MKYFLIFYFLVFIIANIVKIPLDDTPQNKCTICINALNEISDHEFATEIQSDYSTKAFTYLFKCSNNHYFHTWCIASHFYNLFRTEIKLSDYIKKEIPCPNCRTGIKYLDFMQSSINILVSSMKKTPNRIFDKIMLVSSIRFCTQDEFEFFVSTANLSVKELRKIKKACRKTYAKLDDEKLSEMVDRAVTWIIYIIKHDPSYESSLIKHTNIEFYLSLETLKTICDEVEFQESLSDEIDEFAIYFFKTFIWIHKNYKTNVFLDYLKNSIKNYLFFKPHLFDKMRKILNKKIKITSKTSHKTIEFFNEIFEAIENAQNSIYSIFLMKLRKTDKKEYQRIWRLKFNPKLSDVYCRALCFQIHKFTNEKDYCFESIIFDYTKPSDLSYYSYEKICDLILNMFIYNPNKLFLLKEKMETFLLKNSIFSYQFLFENVKKIFLLKNSPGSLNNFLEIIGVAQSKNYENMIFASENEPITFFNDSFSIIFYDFVDKIKIESLKDEMGFYKWCIVCDFIIVLKLKKNILSDYLFRNLFTYVSFEVKKKFNFIFIPNDAEKISDQSALEIRGNFGKQIVFDPSYYRLFFIRFIFNILDFQTNKISEKRFIAQKIYDLLKGNNFCYAILNKLISITNKNNIFISDIGILIADSFNTRLLNKEELNSLIKQITTSKSFISITRTEKSEFMTTVLHQLNQALLNIEDLNRFMGTLTSFINLSLY